MTVSAFTVFAEDIRGEAFAVKLETARICTIAVLRLVFDLIADVARDHRQPIFICFMLGFHLANSLRLVGPAGVLALAADLALLGVELRVLQVLLVVGALALD